MDKAFQFWFVWAFQHLSDTYLDTSNPYISCYNDMIFVSLARKDSSWELKVIKITKAHFW